MKTQQFHYNKIKSRKNDILQSGGDLSLPQYVENRDTIWANSPYGLFISCQVPVLHICKSVIKK